MCVLQTEFTSLFLMFFQISHIIREIRQFQQTAYKIDLQPKVNEYQYYKQAVLSSVWHVLP